MELTGCDETVFSIVDLVTLGAAGVGAKRSAVPFAI
jgi:hypothetical protein